MAILNRPWDVKLEDRRSFRDLLIGAGSTLANDIREIRILIRHARVHSAMERRMRAQANVEEKLPALCQR
jgi:hypothetical protein